eukprot:jgi/Psemu1/285664/fgenesh1_pg.97_\
MQTMISPDVVTVADDDKVLTPRKSSVANKISPRRVLFGDNAGSRNDGVDTLRGENLASTKNLVDSPSLRVTQKKRKAIVVTPSATTTTEIAGDDDDDQTETAKKLAVPSAKRRLLFGRYVELVQTAPNVDSVYKIVRKLTGNIGGNGYSGPIYGELTKHSMQKMVDLMVKNTGFSSSSRFIDVGSGIGKPNLHVAQYPGVEFSCGVEMEHNRWSLGMTCLKACLNAAARERENNAVGNESSFLQGNTMFLHNNILEAKTFDPFTHVYMFSIGFPPHLWIQLSDMWNKSHSDQCRYLICYSGPKDIIGCYEFDVELLNQIPTSMHGSKESHMGYIYQRTTKKRAQNGQRKSSKTSIACDPLFRPSYNLIKKGLKHLESEVDRQVEEEMGGSRRTRRSHQKTIFSKSYNNI